MSFITVPTPPAQPTLTKAQYIARDTAAIKQQGGMLLSQLAKYAQDTLKKVWQNENYSAQEWLTAQGTKAGDAMKQHGALIVFLAGQGIVIDVSIVKNYTINQDGTVTVS